MAFGIEAGNPADLGATVTPEGVNFAVFSSEADRVEVCLFEGEAEVARLALPERDGDVWSGFVPGLKPWARYGLRAHGPFDPARGLRFNPAKLLLDPYARRIERRLHVAEAMMGYRIGAPGADLTQDGRDSAGAVPKCLVEPPSEFDWRGDRPPARPLRETVIYEAHLRGLTMRHPQVPDHLRGTYLGMASAPILEHLVRLGVTAVELLPIQAFIDDRFLTARGLTNYWGYQSMGFFAPEPRYGAGNGMDEVRAMVQALHGAGIEVILDVVYNHTGEGDEFGPTLAFRGLDNRSYYRLAPDPRRYLNETGTGNTLNLAHPMVLRMVMDSLRHWVREAHVDGFRFDLATTLAREWSGFDPGAGFLDALRQDPVLRGVKLIAEPWDLGPGGYRLGEFPHPFLEWNDRFRDGVRRFWRGDPGMTADLAGRLLGSAERFDRDGRAATSSVNFVTAHDGFTLSDLVSFETRHNEANGEGNRDGHGENFSANHGVEGATDDPAVRAARDRTRRALMATLLLAQGTPMLLAGDELGNSQGGNNNAYAQDNATGWIDWAGADEDFLRYVARLIALRHRHPVLRQRRFLHSQIRARDGLSDMVWRKPDGRTPTPEDWANPDWRTLCAEIRGAAEGPEGECGGEEAFLVLNAGADCEVTLPEGGGWRLVLDSAGDDVHHDAVGATVRVAARSVALAIRANQAGRTA
ncbi:MAG: glycogen debranching protein GlgX [Pseudomonadota bacterium]